MANVISTYFSSPRAITVGSTIMLLKAKSKASSAVLLRTVNASDFVGAISATVSSVSELDGYYQVLTDAGLLSVSLVDAICFVR